jgi:hypothetical protein
MIDIPNAFVQTRLEDNNFKPVMHLHGKLAELMVQIAPVIINSEGKTALCVRLLKALCGIMKAALLCCQQLGTELKAVGFEVNPCDPCVANEVVKGKELTMVWHADNQACQPCRQSEGQSCQTTHHHKDGKSVEGHVQMPVW